MAISRRGIEAGRAFVIIEALDDTKKVMMQIFNNFKHFQDRLKFAKRQGFDTFTAIGFAVERTIQPLKKLGVGLDKVKKKLQNVKKASDTAFKAMRMGRELRNIGLSISLLGASLSVPFVTALRTGGEFEDALLGLKVAARATDSQMLLLEEKIRRLGRSTSFTSQQIAQAATELARGSFSTQEILVSLEDVLNLSRGGDIPLAEAAKVLVRILRNWNMEASKASQVTDELVFAATQGTATVQELAQSMSFAGGTAARLGLSSGETAIILAKMANKMLFGTKGGTSLNQALLELAANSEKVEESLGFSTINRLTGEFKEPLEILLELSNAMSSLPSGERVTIAADLFNVRGARAAESIVDAIFEITDSLEELEGLEGIAAQARKTRESGILGTFLRVKSAIDDLAISLERALAPTIKAVEEPLKLLINRLSAFVEVNKKLFVSVAKIVGSLVIIGPIIAGVGAAITGIASLISFIGAPLLGVLTGIAAALLAIGAVVRKVSDFIMTNLKPQAMIVWGAIKDQIVRVLDQLKETRQYIRDRFTAEWERLKPVVKESLKSVLEILEEMVPVLGDILVTTIKFHELLADFAPIFSSLNTVLGRTNDVLKQIVDKIEQIKGFSVGGIFAQDRILPPSKLARILGQPLEKGPQFDFKAKSPAGARGPIFRETVETISEKKKELSRESRLEKIRLEEEDLGRRRGIEDRRKREMEIAELRMKLAGEVDEEERVNLTKRIENARKDINRENEDILLGIRKKTIAEFKSLDERREKIREIIKLERSIGKEPTLKIPGREAEDEILRRMRRATAVDVAPFDLEGPMRARILALKKLRESISKMGTAFPEALQKGSLEAAKVALKNDKASRMVTLLGSIDSRLAAMTALARDAAAEREDAPIIVAVD